jgi:hypothetical protein
MTSLRDQLYRGLLIDAAYPPAAPGPRWGTVALMVIGVAYIIWRAG